MQQARKYTIPIFKHFFIWKLRRRIRKESDEIILKIRNTPLKLERLRDPNDCRGCWVVNGKIGSRSHKIEETNDTYYLCDKHYAIYQKHHKVD